MSTVLVDCRFAGLHGGLGTYIRETVTALLKRRDPWRYVLLLRKEDAAWAQSTGASDVAYASAPHYSCYEHVEVPRIVRMCGASVLYAPQFNIPLCLSVPCIATVHDLILHRFPNAASLPRRLAYRLLLRHAIRSAAGIIAVSHATKGDIVRRYGASCAERIVVAHPGVTSSFAPAEESRITDACRRHGISGKYVLYVGNAKQHKNVQLLIDAFTQAKLSGCTLVLVTAGPESAALKLAPAVLRLSSVAQADLPALYSGASACVSATLAEGFGLPMLEAMACGCPVLATDIPAIREACGSHAVLVAPTVQAMSRGMQQIFSQPRAERADAARRHAIGYTWNTTADAVAGMLKKLVR